jgi:hypothetical protein
VIRRSRSEEEAKARLSEIKVFLPENNLAKKKQHSIKMGL